MYSKAIEINPSETVYYSNRAKALRKLGRLQEAKSDCIEAIEIDD